MEIQPVLASTLYEAHLAKQEIGSTAKLKTGLPHVNQVLAGGFDYGSISCLSTEHDTVCPELVFDVATSHLLEHPEAKMTAVLHASSNSFDVRKLRDRLVKSLIKKGTPQSEARPAAFEALKRVTLMRVFDFVGMAESVSEHHENLETDIRHAAAEAIAPVPARKTTMPESQSDGEGEEVGIQAVSPAAETTAQAQTPLPHGLLLIDSFSNLVQPLFKTKDSQSQGQILLDSFVRRLRHLTFAFDVCTLLICTTDVAKDETSSPSIFASCTALPRLGMALSPLIDLHILIHLVPQTAQDARARYSTQPVYGHSQPGMVSVVEVSQDRSSNREGRWTAVRDYG